MAWYVVCDAIERPLAYFDRWHDKDEMAPYFGGRNKLNNVEERLRMVHAWVLDVRGRLYREEGQIGSVPAPVKEWVKRLKRVLYEMDDLFEEVDIAERERKQLPAGCNIMPLRPLCILASSYNPSFRKVQNRLNQKVEALMGDLLETHNSMPEEAVGLAGHTEKDHYEAGLYDGEHQRLTQCKAYCSLFPKGCELMKTDLIYLWMAQGFLEKPLSGDNQTPQQVGHDTFMDLLYRRVLKRQKVNEIGEVISCKMDDQDYLHEVATGKSECLLVDKQEDLIDPLNKEFYHLLVDEHGDLIENIDNTIYHVSFIVGSSWEAPSWLLAATQLRSLLVLPSEPNCSVTIQNVEELLSSLTSLRALDLGRANSHKLPNSVGGLKHLRYLKFGGSLEVIPQSITRLHYLQTLDLQSCDHRLLKISRGVDNFYKNVVLRCGADEYHSLAVDKGNSSLDALVRSGQAVGKLEIFFKWHRPRAVSEATAADLNSKLVSDLVFEWSSSYQIPDAHADMDEEELIMKRIKPPQSLKSLAVRFWKGRRFPSWEMSPYLNLPSLVSLEIEGCSRCTYLPSFSRLPSLRHLQLVNLKALEDIEEIDNKDASAGYFPSLENLKLEHLPELKGWSSKTKQLVFPQLSHLRILHCPRLMSMPQVPMLESLSVEEIHRELLKHLQNTQESPTASSTRPTLQNLQIASVSQLHSLSICLDELEFLRIKRCEQLVYLRIATASSNRINNCDIEICNCSRLRYISGELQKNLKIWRCEELDLWHVMEDDDGCSTSVESLAWPSLKELNWWILESIVDLKSHSLARRIRSVAWQHLMRLTSLTLGSITKIESLPRGIVCLTGLRSLTIFQLRNLRALPEWIGLLRYLIYLEIVDCSNMRTLFVSSSDLQLDSSFNRFNLPDLTIRIKRCQGMIDNVFGGTRISFKCLEIHRCDRLKDASGEDVVFKELVLDDCRESQWWEDNAGSWQRLTPINYLTLKKISKLETSFPRGLASLTALDRLKISELPNLRELPEWIGHLIQLRRLDIEDCPNMQMLFASSPGSVGSAAWQRLRGLKYLTLKRISELKFLPEGLACLTALQYLEISEILTLGELPEWIGHLIQLYQLEITNCPRVAALPESLCQLTSLRTLLIVQCNPELVRRCKCTVRRIGEDWHKIKHIPCTFIR